MADTYISINRTTLGNTASVRARPEGLGPELEVSVRMVQEKRGERIRRTFSIKPWPPSFVRPVLLVAWT